MIDETVIANLKESMGGDGEIVQKLIDLYIVDAPRQFANAKAALEKGDAVTLGRAAHSLKSTSASMGATAVLALAMDLERHAKGNDLARCDETIKQLAPEISSAIGALSTLKF
jgi:histidine phosphotransfer protein HptB